VVIECERPVVKTSTDSRAALLGCLFFGLLGAWLFARVNRESRVIGRDVRYAVPLRVCEMCDCELSDTKSITRAVRAVPVCDALLEKYPGARITRRG
jgi:hypothetical protein